MRIVLQIVVSLLIVALGGFAMIKLFDLDKKERPKPKPVVKTVFVDTVQNGLVPIVIEANGNLTAKRRVELYSEVQGVLIGGSKVFKPGQVFRKGETLLRLDASEFRATVNSQKSNLINQITAILPDLRLDYPEAYAKWELYVNSYNINKSLSELPEITSDKERYFITGRNILTSYYNVKNLEQRLYKYRIVAPYTGILTEANVTEGALVRSGQKIGEFIETGIYELPVAISKTYADLLKVGKEVTLKNLDDSKEYKGVVTRINGNIEQASQTITAFIEVKDESLREGMYLEAKLNARQETDAITIDRNLLQSEKQLFVVRDTILDIIDVKPVYFSEKTVVIKGVPNGTILVNKPVPGAYAGMRVKVYEKNKTAKTE
ncbi:HlyD family efflux transporter periplasmic adaptor subunit [uncultured Dokdonia sp.]|uniref:efflux RND transporter periplasmic adaptor subunit n=1 Tax=uncultured Dokdonia sp. TaxID=575653 RepID=UPI002610F56E|nr:HlyD family efflux transporter periplasmic adaptor subunit [uncultured Dokdonia sp.]